ncbi:MAG: bifunctional ornithine acetyltransferase/N-acetylglutamate synthase, partial [Pseudomonadota bacterium]
PERLGEDGWLDAGRAIMTTDPIAKVRSAQAQLDGRTITVSGMAKGSGMIRPDMATMLAFVATDAAASPACLDLLLKELCEESFNAITVDGDTSTNDAFILAATGASGADRIDDPASSAGRALKALLAPLVRELAQAIVRDGEGATKFVTVRVAGGRTLAECREVAFTVAQSPLVKTALFASDPNWGRLAMAIGRADVPGLDPDGVSVSFDAVPVMTAGLVDPAYSEAAGARVLAQEEFTIAINLNRGDAQAEVWTSDLSYEYVRINAEYRT